MIKHMSKQDESKGTLVVFIQYLITSLFEETLKILKHSNLGCNSLHEKMTWEHFFGGQSYTTIGYTSLIIQTGVCSKREMISIVLNVLLFKYMETQQSQLWDFFFNVLLVANICE